MMVTVNDIHRKVSLELGIKESIIEEVNRVQYEFTIAIMKGGIDSISLKRIGKILRKKQRNRGFKEHWRRLHKPVEE